MCVLHVSVPARFFSDVQSVTQGDSCFSVSASLLPLPSPFTRNDLIIISTVSHPNTVQVINDYPESTDMLTVSFCGLTSGTVYDYSIEVALQKNRTTYGLAVLRSHYISGKYTIA